MAKTKISEYNATASSNTDVDGINLAEGMAPSLVNNALREIMAHLKDFQAGSAGDSLTVGGFLSVNGSATMTNGLTVQGAFVSDGEFVPSALTTNLASISGGSIDNTVIGASSATTGTFSIITANTKINGPVSANSVVATTVSAGNVFGSFHGSYSGDLTGNVTAGAGTSSFTHMVINGTLNMDAATTATITGLSTPINDSDAASKGYVDSEIAALVSSAPALLDTLGELADALNDDPDFANTMNSVLATKLTLTGGSMTGTLHMGGNTILNIGSASTTSGAINKGQMETQDALKLSLSGGTMSGDLAMGGNRITGLNETPTASSHATSKAYVDDILGSATSAASSQAAALLSAASAELSALAAASSQAVALTHQTNASAFATSAANSFDQFDDIYLGVKDSNPSVDNDGDALQTGAIYYNSAAGALRIYNGSTWDSAAFNVAGVVTSFNTRDGDVTLGSADVTNAMGFRPASTGKSIAMSIVFG